MGPSKVSSPTPGKLAKAWNYPFVWTEHHQTPEQYDHLKYTCDTLAEECLDFLNGLQPSEGQLLNGQADAKDGSGGARASPQKKKKDLYALFRDHHAENEKTQKLWEQVTTIPEWVDWDQIARGQDVFFRYGEPILIGLTYQSLVGGTASARATEVLSRTGGFGIKNVWRRMLETTQFILECTNDLDSIKPGGAGFASCLRVRFLHATVRHRILQIAERHPSYYSTEKWCIPINDLDCIGTIAVFGATVVWQSLPRQGIHLRPQEIEDFIALWRLVGFYMGTPTDHFSTPEKARAIMESLYMYEYTPSETSKLHANNIILAVSENAPTPTSRSYLEANARWLNGDGLSDALGIGRPGLYYRTLIAGQCLLLKMTCYTARAVPFLDRSRLRSVRKMVWTSITSPGSGLQELTTFDFKHVPNVGDHSKNQGSELSWAEKKSKPFWTTDRKTLATLLFLGVTTVAVTWGLAKAALVTYRAADPQIEKWSAFLGSRIAAAYVHK
ncbi:hypothetical protein PV08_04084 [Exophiala spinifera]|uniref:ER-bound oxygenase mpaB/mpaB'/Rubber oxygenase catalytic domain-containing protein n=1 Tax=Exophiala spinifera TaxID=91928 RepID=A0A0D2BZW6_9EURO|nr:uncharacterized protein PV08_04084 [Exophiala spinifera]KIW16894.1 hypothetical protein PV08_04084 [Exophiala spinifera]